MKKFWLKPGQVAIVAVDKDGQPTGDVQVFYFDAALMARTSQLMDPNEDILKEELAKLTGLAGATGGFLVFSGGVPFDGIPDAAKKSEGALRRLFSIFGPEESSEEVIPGPRCPDGFFFDVDFQECFPGACPDGTVFDHFTQQCVAAGQAGG